MLPSPDDLSSQELAFLVAEMWVREREGRSDDGDEPWLEELFGLVSDDPGTGNGVVHYLMEVVEFALAIDPTHTPGMREMLEGLGEHWTQEASRKSAECLRTIEKLRADALMSDI